MTELVSNGKNEARAYAVVVVRCSRAEPAVEIERVQLVDPRHTSTVQIRASSAGAGPRNLEQRAWPAAPAPAIDLPDGRPVTKAQRVFIAPELIARWREEAKRDGSA